MRLTNEDIREFQRLYKERYKKEISREDAYEQGMKLVRMLRVIGRPIEKMGINNKSKS